MIKLQSNKIYKNEDSTREDPVELNGDAIDAIVRGSDEVDNFLDKLEGFINKTADLLRIKQIGVENLTLANIKSIPILTCISSEELVLPDSLKGINKEGLKSNIDQQIKNIYDKEKKKFGMLISTESGDVFSWFFNQFKIATHYSNMLKEAKRKVLGRIDNINLGKFKSYHVTMESYESMYEKLSHLEAVQNEIAHMKAVDATSFSYNSMNNHVVTFQKLLNPIGFIIDPISFRVKIGEAAFPTESALLGDLGWTPAKVKDSIDRVTHLLDNHRKITDTIKSIETTLENLKKNKSQNSTVSVTEVEKALVFMVSLSKHITHTLYRITNCYSKLCEKINLSRQGD